MNGQALGDRCERCGFGFGAAKQAATGEKRQQRDDKEGSSHELLHSGLIAPTLLDWRRTGQCATLFQHQPTQELPRLTTSKFAIGCDIFTADFQIL